MQSTQPTKEAVFLGLIDCKSQTKMRQSGLWRLYKVSPTHRYRCCPANTKATTELQKPHNKNTTSRVTTDVKPGKEQSYLLCHLWKCQLIKKQTVITCFSIWDVTVQVHPYCLPAPSTCTITPLIDKYLILSGPIEPSIHDSTAVTLLRFIVDISFHSLLLYLCFNCVAFTFLLWIL